MSARVDPVGIRIQRVEGRRGWALFERVPEMLLGHHPQFVPVLPGSVRALGGRSHPFSHHGSVLPFVAFRGSRPVGRIAAIVNRTHNEYHGENVGFVGFFDCVDDAEVGAALLQAAERELSGLGHSVLRGPFSPTQNDPCGVLVEGFEHRPAFLMPWNPPHYAPMWERAGWKRAQDLLAFRTDRESPIGTKVTPLLDRFQARSGVTVRSVDIGRFEDEMAVVHRLFNETLGEEWNFMPMGEADLDAAARDLRKILDPDLVLIAEREGRPIGFFLAFPDLNELWARAVRLPRPFRLAALGWQMLRHRPSAFRVAAAGIVAEHRSPSLVAALLLRHVWEAGMARYRHCEISWVQEANHTMRRLMGQIGATPYKAYRVYERACGEDWGR